MTRSWAQKLFFFQAGPMECVVHWVTTQPCGYLQHISVSFLVRFIDYSHLSDGEGLSMDKMFESM
jgi:hypothetical protein